MKKIYKKPYIKEVRIEASNLMTSSIRVYRDAIENEDDWEEAQ